MSDTNLNDASFTPEIQDSEESTNKQTYSATGSFRFWCQKVLPLVYDDSLSYYELLCKVVNYLNSVIQNVDNLNTSVDNTNTAFNNLQNYVNTTKDTLVEVYGELEQYVNEYFNNLDVQEEINTKLDVMASDGSLSEIISPFIPSAVSDWLSQHITPTSPAIDATLTISGAGADAKVTGELIRDLTNDSSALSDEVEGLMTEYANALPMTYTIYDNRIKIFYASYRIINGYIEKVIFLKITTSAITSNGEWTLGQLTPRAYFKTTQNYIDFSAVSLSGNDISNMTFRQTSNDGNNLALITTGAVTPGQGGVIMLTNRQAINDPTIALEDTVYPADLIDNTILSRDLYNSDFVTADYGWNATNGRIGLANGYSYIMKRVIGGSTIRVKGLTESMTTFGYGILDRNRTVIESKPVTPGMIIDIPNDGYWLVFTYPTNDNISLIPYFKKKMVVFGDSWSDNNPEHTTYTKWTSLVQNDGDYRVINYAQNGSTITGDNPNYDLNGNVAGQMETFLNDDIKDVNTFIIFGGLNDFRNGIGSGTVSVKLESFINILKEKYPEARIVYIANHQIFITHEQIEYMHFIANYVRRICGIEGYVTFGWIPALNYIDDLAHPNNAGHKSIYANIKAILYGGDIYYVTNVYGFGGTGINGRLYEKWVNGYPSYSVNCLIYNNGLNTTQTFTLLSSTKDLCGSVPFTKILNKVSPTDVNVNPCIFESTCAESFSGSDKMNDTNTFVVRTPSSNTGTYRTENRY